MRQGREAYMMGGGGRAYVTTARGQTIMLFALFPNTSRAKQRSSDVRKKKHRKFPTSAYENATCMPEQRYCTARRSITLQHQFISYHVILLCIISKYIVVMICTSKSMYNHFRTSLFVHTMRVCCRMTNIAARAKMPRVPDIGAITWSASTTAYCRSTGLIVTDDRASTHLYPAVCYCCKSYTWGSKQGVRNAEYIRTKRMIPGDF